jgi:hypothetical protein
MELGSKARNLNLAARIPNEFESHQNPQVEFTLGR